MNNKWTVYENKIVLQIHHVLKEITAGMLTTYSATHNLIYLDLEGRV